MCNWLKFLFRPRSRKVCAWCKRDMGPSPTRENSHGICKECEREFLAETQDYREEGLQRRESGR